jgi:cysteine desulfurase
MSNLIYLDNHATTPCDPAVVEAMLPYFGHVYANPSSTVHGAGREAAEAVDKAREQVAALVEAQAGEMVFTSGATESNNIAILGLAKGSESGRRRIVTTAIEHKAVLGPCKELSRQGMDVVVLPVDEEGRINLDTAESAINENTLLVSVQAANNEIGTIQPVAEMARLAHNKGALIHCDAAQAVGKVPVDVNEWDVDFMSVSAHKLYGPKGVGALYIRGGPYSMPLKPLVIGGGQERQLRAGTLNVPGIVGFGEACELCQRWLPDEARRISMLRDRLENEILARVEGAWRNGPLEGRLPGNSSLTFPETDADALIINTPDLAISTGSACTSGAPEPSHVLLAIGLTREDAGSTTRIGIGRFNNEEEVSVAVDSILEALGRLSRLRVG